MGLDPDEAQLLGEIKSSLSSHIKFYTTKYDEDKEFRRNVYRLLDKLDAKNDEIKKHSDEAHDRIDRHEDRFSTVKYMVALMATVIGTAVSAVYSHFRG